MICFHGMVNLWTGCETFWRWRRSFRLQRAPVEITRQSLVSRQIFDRTKAVFLELPQDHSLDLDVIHPVPIPANAAPPIAAFGLEEMSPNGTTRDHGSPRQTHDYMPFSLRKLDNLILGLLDMVKEAGHLCLAEQRGTCDAVLLGDTGDLRQVGQASNMRARRDLRLMNRMKPASKSGVYFMGRQASPAKRLRHSANPAAPISPQAPRRRHFSVEASFNQ
jgi:hypothetical protein